MKTNLIKTIRGKNCILEKNEKQNEDKILMKIGSPQFRNRIFKYKLFANITNTLRGKLSLWYLISMGLIIFLFLITSSILFSIILQNQIDHHIQIAVNEAGQIVEKFNGQQREELIKNLVSTKSMTVVVLSPDGSPILETKSTDVIPTTEHQLQKILSLSNLYESSITYFTVGNIRFATKTIKIDAGKGIVAVGYSTKILYATSIKMLGVVIAIIILLIFPLTLIGYKFLKKQLFPLESIAFQAKRVSNLSSLSKRIYIPSPTKELDEIQNALNLMLSKLENIFEGEKKFFSDAAHTLKTPLAILRVQIENSKFSKKTKLEFLKTIDNANETIQDLLLLSKIDSKSRINKKFSLSNLMINLSELAVTLGENKNLIVSSSIQKNINLKADKKLLQRALGNIIHNAILYNKTDGYINLELKQQSNRITITIENTGIGISKKDQPKIFNRFYRASNANSHGTGLGLSISKAVIENLNGVILLESSLNKNTIIKIIFQK